MKRTISEVIEIIKQKKESAEKEFDNMPSVSIDKFEKITKMNRLIGTMEAYADVLALLETSHLTDQEKAIEILKPRIKFVEEPVLVDGKGYIIVWIQTKGFILKNGKEYDILSEVLNVK